MIKCYVIFKSKSFNQIITCQRLHPYLYLVLVHEVILKLTLVLRITRPRVKNRWATRKYNAIIDKLVLKSLNQKTTWEQSTLFQLYKSQLHKLHPVITIKNNCTN